MFARPTAYLLCKYKRGTLLVLPFRFPQSLSDLRFHKGPFLPSCSLKVPFFSEGAGSTTGFKKKLFVHFSPALISKKKKNLILCLRYRHDEGLTPLLRTTTAKTKGEAWILEWRSKACEKKSGTNRERKREREREGGRERERERERERKRERVKVF